MTRAQTTVTRDKNHPSVLVWSVGNENPLPQTCVEVGDYVGQLDPSRPYCFPQVGSYFRKFFEGEKAKGFPSSAPIYAPHYPTTGQIGGFYQHLDRPVIFTEYCHTLGISFEDHDRQWEIIERTPGIAGGSVWEWADQGMQSPPWKKGANLSKWRTDGSERDQRVITLPLATEENGGKTGGFEMHGNFGTDGLVYADRTPLPNYYELQHNYARAFVEMESGRLTCHNRYDFLNLKDHVVFHWVVTADRDTVARGSFSPDCPPHSSVPYALTLPAPNPQKLTLLHVDIEDVQGCTFLHQSFVLNKPAVEWTGMGDPLQMVQEQKVRTGRKATMAERITQKGRLPGRYLLSVKDGVAVLADTARILVDIVMKHIDGGQEVSFTLTPDSSDVFRSELGLSFLLHPAHAAGTVIQAVDFHGYLPLFRQAP